MTKPNSVILLICCPDKRGIIAQVTGFINDNNGNIISLDEHVDPYDATFYMRVEWDLEKFIIPPEKIFDYFETLLAIRNAMTWKIHFKGNRLRMVLYVSKLSHCMYDILSRVYSGELDVDIPLIISNHKELESVAQQFNVPFYCFEKRGDNKKDVEQKEIELLKNMDVDVIVLARYMQILSSDFIALYPNAIINIHHSFLPAFPGAKPHHSAYERGVKIVGATSHYVTPDLDAGPIIEQGVIHVSHRDAIDTLVRKGKDIEKVVLSNAIRLHVEHRLLVHKNRTIVFN